MADKSSFYRERAKALEKRLEREQEWETYFPGITNREYATYADACACGMARRWTKSRRRRSLRRGAVSKRSASPS